MTRSVRLSSVGRLVCLSVLIFEIAGSFTSTLLLFLASTSLINYFTGITFIFVVLICFNKMLLWQKNIHHIITNCCIHNCLDKKDKVYVGWGFFYILFWDLNHVVKILYLYQIYWYFNHCAIIKALERSYSSSTCVRPKYPRRFYRFYKALVGLMLTLLT